MNNLKNDTQTADIISEELIKDILDQNIEKDVLMNSAQDFSGEGEEKYLAAFRSYLRSASYILDKRVRA